MQGGRCEDAIGDLTPLRPRHSRGDVTPFKRRDSAEQLRILVTGSRRWADRIVIRHALEREFEAVAGYVEADEITVVHGAQGVYEEINGVKVLTMGADMMADEQAKVAGDAHRSHPGRLGGAVRRELPPRSST